MKGEVYGTICCRRSSLRCPCHMSHVVLNLVCHMAIMGAHKCRMSTHVSHGWVSLVRIEFLSQPRE